jgi:aryl-alcohol dehydrogenase-like predicted oxidoreductase
MDELKMHIGKTDLSTRPLGVGTWSWGDAGGWGYGKTFGKPDVRQVFEVSVESGITFFDTAESYGDGNSERLIGEFIRNTERRVVVATKFSPARWQVRRKDLIAALKKSLARLRVSSVDLYQVHWPSRLVTVRNRAEALADALEMGLTRAVGVSNHNRDQMLRAYETLESRGFHLASNQVEFSLLHRTPEMQGLLAICSSLGVTVIAYSPLAMGVLTGKYSRQAPPPGSRGVKYLPHLEKIEKFVRLLREIGETRGGKTISQVAINWVICKGAFPIIGLKTRQQAEEMLGALGWKLSLAEIRRLDEESLNIQI